MLGPCHHASIVGAYDLLFPGARASAMSDAAACPVRRVRAASEICQKCRRPVRPHRSRTRPPKAPSHRVRPSPQALDTPKRGDRDHDENAQRDPAPSMNKGAYSASDRRWCRQVPRQRCSPRHPRLSRWWHRHRPQAPQRNLGSPGQEPGQPTGPRQQPQRCMMGQMSDSPVSAIPSP